MTLSIKCQSRSRTHRAIVGEMRSWGPSTLCRACRDVSFKTWKPVTVNTTPSRVVTVTRVCDLPHTFTLRSNVFSAL